MREVYLDNSATTAVCGAAVIKAAQIMENIYGNPSSLHSKGFEAEKELEAARVITAEKLFAEPGEIYFTSGGTEANNLAVLGTLKTKRRGKIVTTAIEHSSVLGSVSNAGDQFEKLYLKPDSKGVVPESAIFEAIDKDTVLVSIMAVNNEIGTIQNIKSAAAAIKRAKSSAVLHVDAVQAFCKITLNPRADSIDLLSISAHKIHGPKGTGALYVRKGLRILPLFFGGEQEKKIRPGTENLPMIAAFGEAVRDYECSPEHIKGLRDYALQKLSSISAVKINSTEKSIPHIIHFSVPGIKSETMLRHLSQNGVFVSSGSACAKGRMSHVLEAVNMPRELADSAIRVSFSRFNTTGDIDILADAVLSGVERLITGKKNRS